MAKKATTKKAAATETTKAPYTFTEVKYAFRRNLGAYEHQDISLTASLTEGASVEQVIADMQRVALASVGQFMANEKPATEEAASPKKPAKGKRKPKVEEESEEEDEDESEEESEDEDEAEEAEEEKPKKSKKAPAKTTKAPTKKGRSKASPFDRNSDLHKDLVGSMLEEEISKKWRGKEKLVKKARNAAKEMDGEDFLDAEGVIMESFKEKYLELMD